MLARRTIVLISTVLALAVAGCGIRGSLENPPDQPPKTTASADSGQGKAEGQAGKPHEGFILDPLLR